MRKKDSFEHENRKKNKTGRKFRPSLSLGTKTVLSVLTLTVILSAVSLYLGSIIHRRMEVKEHMSDTWKMASSASALLDSMNVYEYVEKALEIYTEKGGRDLSIKIKELRERLFDLYSVEEPDEAALSELEAEISKASREYQELFAEVLNGDFVRIHEILYDFAERNNLNDISVLAFDQETESLFNLYNSSTVEPDKDWHNYLIIGEPLSLSKYAGLEEYYRSGSKGQHSFSYNVPGEVKGTYFSSIAPYMNPETGELIAYIDAFEIWDAGGKDQRMYALNYLLGIVIAAVILAILSNFLTRRSIVRPILKLNRAAVAYGKQKDKQGMNYFGDLGIETGDEIQTLGETMKQLEGDLNQYMGELTQVTKEKERVSAELQMATKIQASMLPNIFPPFPDRKDFDIYASMKPAREVGGDFYDYFLIDDQHLAILIADVSDKGIPAALFMMATKILINYRVKLGGTPAEILASVNAEICSSRSSGHTKMFVTVWLGILDLSNGTLLCANAGHEYPSIRRGDSTFKTYEDKHSFVVGGLQQVKYKDYELKLERGDAVFVYTDGVPEANNEAGEFYGLERMGAALDRLSKGSPKEILDGLEADVEAFAAGAEQFDDMTMLCLEYKGG